jgi:hypothetical protein
VEARDEDKDNGRDRVGAMNEDLCWNDDYILCTCGGGGRLLPRVDNQVVVLLHCCSVA